MFGPTVRMTRNHQAWLRAVIFVGLYLMLLLSFTQCALVLYLYGTGQVDGLLTPSLIIALIASFLSVPFVIIHTILSWQYRKVPGLNMPRNALHMACSHLPRIMVATWLAASVAGLVVVSKQATCLPASETEEYWKAGMGCQIHRPTVILSILAFFTTSALFFCFQVCERPYDTSLLGLYAPQRPPRDGSIFSESSWESETLKNEIFYLCRHPDAGPVCWLSTNSSLLETPAPVRPPTMRYQGPARVRPQLHLNTHTNSVRPSIVATSAADTSPKVSPIDETAGSISLNSDVSPLSRNPSMTSTLQMGTEAAFTRPPVPKVPDIPEVPSASQPKQQQQHKRQKSSVSSHKFLPRSWDLSEPLSEDPQIRALASPPLFPETQIAQQLDQTEKEEENVPDNNSASQFPTLPSPPEPARVVPAADSVHTRRRSMTTPGNPPPVLPPVPLTVRKSQTSHLNSSPRSIHHPHHPNYVPQGTPKSSMGGGSNRPLQGHKSMTASRLPPRRQASMGHGQYPAAPTPVPRISPSQASLTSHHGSMINRNQSQKQRFHTSGSLPRNAQFARHATPHHPPLPNNQRQHYQHQQQQQHIASQPRHRHQQQQHQHPSARPAYVRRFHSNDGRGFNPARTLPPIPRSDDTATLYPSTRRPRSSTYGGSSSNNNTGLFHNSAVGGSSAQGQGQGQGRDDPETKKTARQRTSLSLAEGGVALEADREIVEKRNTYRGAERTSIYGGGL